MGYKPKWYDNKAILESRYVMQRKSIPEIAKEFGVSEETIRKLLIKHRLKRGK